MAHASGPLLSATARGSIADLLTFSRRKTGQQVRFQKRQEDFVTTGRAAARSTYSLAVAEWGLMDTETKKQWKLLAYSLEMTGYNLFMGLAIGEGVSSAYGQHLYGLFTLGS